MFFLTETYIEHLVIYMESVDSIILHWESRHKRKYIWYKHKSIKSFHTLSFHSIFSLPCLYGRCIACVYIREKYSSRVLGSICYLLCADLTTGWHSNKDVETAYRSSSTDSGSRYDDDLMRSSFLISTHTVVFSNLFVMTIQTPPISLVLVI